MISDELRNAYRYQRQRDFEAPHRASGALLDARRDVARGKARYPSSPLTADRFSRPVTNAADRTVYLDRLDKSGFRFVGFADEMARGRYSRRIDHNGWFTDIFQDATLRGAVLQISGRRGCSRFVAAYVESDDGLESDTGGFVVDLSKVYEEPAAKFYGERDASACDSAWEAAISADQMAERDAEREREYNEGWNSGRRFASLADDISALRGEALDILAERRTVRHVQAPSLCAAIRRRLESILDDIREARSEREKLRDQFDNICSNVRRAELQSAFNEGAGSPVFTL
jgi:hypothetical protein